MAILFANNAFSPLINSLSDSGLVIQVAPGDGAKFPQPVAPDDYFLVTLENAEGTIREIVKIVSRSGDVLTIDPAGRGFDHTTARAWAAGMTIVDHRATAFVYELCTGGAVINTTVTKGTSPTSGFTSGEILFSSAGKVSGSAELKFDDATDTLSTGTVQLRSGLATQKIAVNASASTHTWTLPVAPEAGKYMTTDAAGQLSWGVPAGGIIKSSELTVAMGQAAPNATFSGVFESTPVAGTTAVYINGVRIPKNGFTISGLNIALVDSVIGFSISVGDLLTVEYQT